MAGAGCGVDLRAYTERDGTAGFVERTEEAQAKIVVAAASSEADASTRSLMENIQR
jgi:hypothetical protein